MSEGEKTVLYALASFEHEEEPPQVCPFLKP